MASIDQVYKLTEKQRNFEVYLSNEKYSSHEPQPIEPNLISIDKTAFETNIQNYVVNLNENLKFNRAYCYSSEFIRRQMKFRCFSFRWLVARYAASVLMSMLFLLSSAQDIQDIQEVPRSTINNVSTDAKFNTTNESSSARSNTTFKTSYITQSEPEKANQSFPTQSKMHIQHNKIIGVPITVPSASQGVSLNRKSLIHGESLLQQQLREKIKQESLESIKMHILLRLNMNKLPNITKPISVPQNILENFYKNYNASLLKSTWRYDSQAAVNAVSRTGLNYFDEVLTKSSISSLNGTKAMPAKRNLEYEPTENPSAANSSVDMQGDDPNAFEEFQFIYNIDYDERYKNKKFVISNDNEDEYENILSHINSIYIFPEQSHMRHNRKPDLLRFKLASGSSDISYVTLHLYLRGLEWINIHQPKIIKELEDFQNKDIVVTIQRTLHRANNLTYAQKAKMFEFRHKIPQGLGQWVNVDLKPLFGTVITSDSNKTQEIFIKGVESWMKPLVVTTDNGTKNPLTVHIEIGSRKKHRRKRSIFLDCAESDNDIGCCRYPLKVNFTSFGWHFVVAPTSFDAYFCSGDCRVGYLEQYPHTHLAALTTSATPCCSPTKMSSLSLLYFDDNHQLVLSVIPNMSVEGCSCS